LRAEGLELPPDLTYKALENTDKVFHFVIPAKPTELSDEDLKAVSGGDACGANRPDSMRSVKKKGHTHGSGDCLLCGL
jgi:bacteriocin-like protein